LRKNGFNNSRITYVFAFFIGCLLILAAFNYVYFAKKIENVIYSTTLTVTKNLLRKNVEDSQKSIEEVERFKLETCKKRLKETVENAWIATNAVYNFCRKKGVGKRKLEELVERTLNKLKLKASHEYFFAEETKGRVIFNQAFPQLKGRNLWNWQDLKGTYVHRKFAEVALYSPNNGGFVSFYWFLPGKEEKSQVIAYVKLFKPLNWIIGALELSSLKLL